ncbi:MAG: M20 aminoacylase family protein [Hyphomicrobiales bacterium]
MPLLNSAVAAQPEIAVWRRTLHQTPELMYDTFKTAAFVDAKLREFGCDEVVTGIGRTGVVGLIKGRGDGPTIGLRADMDALPIAEATSVPYKSKVPGSMHACGHDGHTAMLLGAARHLCETRNFNGRVAVIFQPAEEGGGGGKAMLDDGMIERFSIERFYGLHNAPGLPVGTFATRRGSLLAAMDVFSITVTGRGGHAAAPHLTVDPVFVGAQIVSALQGIAARNANPLDSVVLSVTQFHAGDAFNVIPQTATIAGTIRSLKQELRDLAVDNLKRTVEGIAAALGASATISDCGILPYPVTHNHTRETDVIAGVAAEVSGTANVNDDCPPDMASEDFAFMLQRKPGAMILMGNGNTAALHNPYYDFSDEAIPYGVSFWVRLVETELR